MKFKLVIFDLDGTLIDLPIDYTRLRDKLGIGLQDSILEAVAKLSEKERKSLFDFWEQVENEALDRPIELLSKSKGVTAYNHFKQSKRVLVTLQGRKLAERVCQRMSWDFEVIISREDDMDRWGQLTKVLRELGVTCKEEVLLVGNNPHDFVAAKKVGCFFLGV